jgi:hypothetical protein
MPQVRAIASLKLARKQVELNDEAARSTDTAEAAHLALLARDIKRFLDDPDAFKRSAPPVVPPGAPIGEPAWNWLGLFEPPCTHWAAAMGGAVRR